MVLAVLAAAGPVRAQSPTTGALSGVIRDASGDALGGVLVTLRDQQTGLARSVLSSRAGAYRFALVAPGEYGVSIEKLSFRPVRIAAVRIAAGAEQVADATLAALASSAPPGAGASEAPARASAAAMAADMLPGWTFDMLPHAYRGVEEVARLSSRTDAQLGVEGLPSWFTTLQLDGVAFRPARHPLLWAPPVRITAFALGAYDAGAVVSAPADVEWSGAAGGWIDAQARRGAARAGGTALGTWSGSSLPGGSVRDAPSHQDVQGALSLRLPLGDSARLHAGIELHRVETPFARAWGDSPAAATLAGLGDSYGVDFAAYRRAGLARNEALAGFARLDWSVAARHRLVASAAVAAQPQLAGRDLRSGLLQPIEAADLAASAQLVSALGPDVHNDLRISVTGSSRSTAEQASAGPAWIVSDDLSMGGLRGVARGEELRVSITEAIHVVRGAHVLKLGGGVRIASQQYDYRAGAEGEVYFGGVEDLLARRGALLRVDGVAPGADWQTTTPVLFAQDRVQLGDGLTVALGASATRTRLPQQHVARDAEWQRLSGLANDSVAQAGWRADLRAGLTWNVPQARQWTLFAHAGVYHDEIDPLLLAQWQMDAGGARVRREIGELGWPTDAGPSGSLRRLTLLGYELAAPRTARLAAGASLALSPSTALRVSAVTRRTEHLPRRSDLNLLPLPASRDQHGRAVYGTLIKQGALLAAEPGSGRRFPSYDEVAAINDDGWSEHWGVTVGFDAGLDAGRGFLARYTFSRTRDNWFRAREGGWTVAVPAGLDGSSEWAHGVSDFDAPHRLVAAATVPLPLGIRLGAIYRGESGLPFTPGYRRGVDANGDGWMDNDPAHIDAGIAGMNELIARWPCLAESRGRIVARNACRGAATHALDLSFGMHVLRLGRGMATLNVDAFDLLATAGAQPDAALYLLDPAGALQYDSASRRIEVPLVLNPRFGEPLVRPHTGRRFRLGITVKW